MDSSEIDQLKADLRRIQARVDELEKSEEEPTNRRNMLRGLGAAAAGAAVGGLAFARPAAAVDGATFIIGDDTQTAQTTTGLITGSGGWTAHANKAGFFVSDFVGNAANGNGIFATFGAYCDGSTGGGHSTAIFGSSEASGGVGAFLDAEYPLKLTDFTDSGPPSTTFGRTGAFKQDNGDLWFCTYDDGLFGGENPKWRKLVGPNSAGAFHAITPARVYDSRLANPMGGVGVISVGQNRIVSVKDKRSNTDGTVIQSNTVPANATAVACNVTVTGTVGGFGYLAINPGNVAAEGASTINWTASGQSIANGVILTLDGSRQVNVICNGLAGNSTHFILDVTGYFL